MKRVALALAVLGLAAALLAWHSLDLVVRVALERWGPDVTGVEVDVARVGISPLDGRGRIAGLDIGNPVGFASPRAARLGEVRLAIDLPTLASGVTVVRELALVAPEITYERGDKSTNLETIQRHIEAYAKRAEAGGGKGAGGGVKRRFVIERLSIRKAKVTISARGLRGQGLVFDLPDVELRDVGKRQGGVTASQAAAIVAGALQQRIAVRVLTNVEALRRGGVEGAIDALKGLVK